MANDNYDNHTTYLFIISLSHPDSGQQPPEDTLHDREEIDFIYYLSVIVVINCYFLIIIRYLPPIMRY